PAHLPLYSPSFHAPRARAELPSFPTRRSSDLLGRKRRVRRMRMCVGVGVRVAVGEVGPGAGRPMIGARDTRPPDRAQPVPEQRRDRKSTRLNSSHRTISYAVFCLKKKKIAREE